MPLKNSIEILELYAASYKALLCLLLIRNPITYCVAYRHAGNDRNKLKSFSKERLHPSLFFDFV